MKNLLPLFALVTVVPAFGHEGGEAELEVGPGKGVAEVSKDKAFKLSPEAMKRFEIQTTPVKDGQVSLPKAGVVRTLTTSQVFRVRDGWIKSIDFEKVSQNGPAQTVRSKHLTNGDSVVTNGVGYLRIIAAQLGEPEDDGEGHAGHADELEHSKKEGEHHD